MTSVDALIIWGMRLLRAAVIVKAMVLLLQMATDQEQIGQYKRRLKNLLIFAVCAESVRGLLTIIGKYYGH